jgi:AcrR family transcriptional regulator
MAKIKQSPKLPAEQRRQQLLRAARRLFMKRGFRGTTTEAIARRAGLTKGALYFHFKNKEEILFELIKSMHEEVDAAVDALPEGKASPADMLRIMMDQSKYHAEIEFEAYLDFWVQASKIPRVFRYLKECMKRTNEVFIRRMDPKFAPTARERRDLAILLFAVFDGLTVRKMLGDETVHVGRQLKLFASLMEGQATQQQRKRKRK